MELQRITTGPIRFEEREGEMPRFVTRSHRHSRLAYAWVYMIVTVRGGVSWETR